MTAEEFLKNRKNIHDKTISDCERIMDFWEIAEIMQEYADHKQLIIADVIVPKGTLFCQHCESKNVTVGDGGLWCKDCGKLTKRQNNAL